MTSKRGGGRSSVGEFLFELKDRPFLTASLLLLLLAMVIGGASQGNLVQTLVLEIAACALAPWALYRLSDRFERAYIWPLLILGAIALLTIAQLTPLPPALWTLLDKQHHIQETYKAAGIPLGWRPISVAPALTLHSAAALLVPGTVFLSWLTLSNKDRRRAIWVVLLVAFVGLILGALQLSGSHLAYLYERTNIGALVGFFSNRNHEASLLLCLLPLTAAIVVGDSRRQAKTPVIAAIGLALTVIVMVGLATARSRAGILLFIPSLVLSLAVLARSERVFRAGRVTFIIGGALALALLLVVYFALDPIIQRFSTDLATDLRFAAAADVLKAGAAALPFGTGMGSFDMIFRSVERLELVGPQFLNHAHDDYLEVLLETGVFGLALLLAYVAWAGKQSWSAWRRVGAHNGTLARSGSIVIGLLLAHSAVDYPLRTIALSSVFALASALLIAPPGRAR